MFLSVTGITTSGANLVVKGKGASGTTVKIVKNGNQVGQNGPVNNSGDWEITIPTAGNSSFTVEGGGKEEDITVTLTPGGQVATVTNTIPVTPGP